MSEEMKALRKQLLRDERSGYDVLDAAQLAEMEAYCADYKAFLTNGKTERLSVREAVAAAEAKGFVPYRRGMELKAGDKVRFEAVSVQAAQQALHFQRGALALLADVVKG